MIVVDPRSVISFVMFDGLKPMICKVDRDALVGRATVDGIDETDISATYDRHREAIQAIASRNYDARQASPIVTTYQLTPFS
ncbi:DUF1488 family protein [Bradyrhizobium yuanmingense]|uniref:DUF1488 family protein n=1 Tax=Bradyrhizobium yuanmingense TaxID=108015 RepID=UPI0023B9231D|nr:DUF1488 family protein [Bradyrhizobium yuanmingense]MDF0583780.1 DUF1488 family protein [Bradyrhizobium yuanmingense]